MDANWANYVGYAASFFVVELYGENIKQIRVINLIGCMLCDLWCFQRNVVAIIIPNAVLLRYTTLSFNKTRLKVLHNEKFLVSVFTIYTPISVWKILQNLHENAYQIEVNRQ